MAFVGPQANLRGQKVVVVGLAQTGIAVARFCHRHGAEVIVTDGKPADQLAAKMAALDGVPVTWQLGGHDLATFTSADLVVMSPGVPTLPEMTAARAAGVEVIAEIELAYRCLHPEARVLAITGTNGKSTTTALAGALCAASGRPSFCGGNLGNMPMIDAVDHPANAPGGLSRRRGRGLHARELHLVRRRRRHPHQRHAPITSIASAPSSATPR
jgi:UDP-N-acetylmuramoylalanine--D-glutamate ligase